MSSVLLTAKQRAFISWYVKLKNATRAAEKAGYEGDRHTLEQVGYENLRKPEIKGEIDRLFQERLPSPGEVLDLITTRAKLDITPYLREDLTLDVAKLREDGLGHWITGVKPGRQGPEVTLVDPQTATKMLARYHRLLDRHLDVDLHTTQTLDGASIDALAAQIAAAQESSTDTDDTE